MKKLVLILLIMIGAITMQGCFSSEIGIESKNKALAYLNERYAEFGDTFTPVSYVPSSWQSNEEILYFHSEKYDGDIKIIILDRDEIHQITDNYYCLYLKEDFENAVKASMAKVGVNYDFEITVRTPLKNPPKTLEEYIELGNNYDFVGIIFYSDSDYDTAKLYDLVDELDDYNFKNCIGFSILDEQVAKEDLLTTYEYVDGKIYKWSEDDKRIEVKK